MDEDVRSDETTDDTEDTTDRREFLKRAGMIGGGALAAIAGLASAAEAQYDIRRMPQGRMSPTLRLPQLQLKSPAAASVEQFEEIFREMKEAISPPLSDWWSEEQSQQVAEMIGDLNDPSAIAAVNVLQMSGRFKESRGDTTANLTILYTLLAEGMEQVRASGVDPRAMGSGCGQGCGNSCGNACLSPVAAGFICGNGCGSGCAGAEAMGLQCGNGCQQMGLRQLTIDPEGMALKGRNFKGLNMKAFAAAMSNAAQAFGKTWPQW